MKTIIINNKETNYMITEDGKVFNKNTKKQLFGSISKHGYRVFTFTIEGKKVRKYLHRLLAIAFLNFDENSNLIVNHIDGNKLNNNLNNLEIITSSQNLIHAYNNDLKKSNLNKTCILYENNYENETWKRIPEYEDYEISNYGRVKSYKYKKPIILRQDIRCGYYSVVLSKNGKTKHFTVHELVYFTFNNENKIKGKIVDHIDGNKFNNKLDNLRYISQSENCLASFYNQKKSCCKKVVAIKDGEEKIFDSIAMASRELNVDASAISKVYKGKYKTTKGYIFKYVD